MQASGHVVSAGLQTGQEESNALPREPPLYIRFGIHHITALIGMGMSNKVSFGREGNNYANGLQCYQNNMSGSYKSKRC